MQMWTGMGVFQWEHKRTWSLAATGQAGDREICRAEGALLVPGFSSLSVFFRRESQSAVGEFEISVWTAPIWFRPLDEDNLSSTPEAYLYKLTVAPATGLNTGNSGTTARVFGAQIADAQPMGSLLFWQVKNNIASAQSITGDLYVVPNHTGTMMLGRLGRVMDGTGLGGSGTLAGNGAYGKGR